MDKRELQAALQNKIDHKTKPLGSLGKLEELALQIGLIQNSLTPKLEKPHMLVFAGDHGIASAGVSAYPQEVTWQMVKNFLNGGAAINVFCRQHNFDLYVVDAGVNYDFALETPGLIHAKIGKGTANYLERPAMTREEANLCLEEGGKIVNNISREGCNIIGFGEMGIGNTSSASIITSIICHKPIDACTGIGTGLDQDGLKRKIMLLEKAVSSRGKADNPLEILATYGGFEIGEMAGAILEAAKSDMVILVDGFIATAAFLIAHAIRPDVIKNAIFCHTSEERGHIHALNYLKVTPLLHLGLRLGEGSGAAVAFPIVASAVNFLNEMASFDSAQVSKEGQRN